MMNISATWFWMNLNLIIRDIREAHKKDSESASPDHRCRELKENLEAVENFKGSRLEKTGNALLQATRYQLQKFIGRRISLAEFGFSKNQRKWEHLSARGKKR